MIRVFWITRSAWNAPCPAIPDAFVSNGLVVDLASDPVREGGWTITVSDVSALARAKDDAHRRVLMSDVLVQ